MVEETEGKKKVNFLLEMEYYNKMEKYASDRGDKYVSGVFRDAVLEYIKKQENPDSNKEHLTNVILEGSPVIKEMIAQQVRDEVQVQLRKILGVK